MGSISVANINRSTSAVPGISGNLLAPGWASTAGEEELSTPVPETFHRYNLQRVAGRYYEGNKSILVSVQLRLLCSY